MTAEEAIKELKYRIKLTKRACLKSMPEQIKVFEMAIEALEKQIAKKPKNIKDYFFPETYDYDYSTADCPCCGENFSFDESYQINFCNGCGQAIDWSEEE